MRVENTTVTSSITFEASLPMIQSAVKVGGEGSMRLQLDIPQSDMTKALPIVGWQGQVLRVTVKPITDKQVVSGAKSGTVSNRSEW